jgi:voltage-gated potassium channel
MSIVAQLFVSTLMVLATILLHLGGLAILLLLIRPRATGAKSRHPGRETASIVLAAFGLFALHGIEIWAYAILYTCFHAAPDLETALYFSTSTYTTVGYGDVLLSRSWRLVGAIEGANGIILLGWSTAFFVGIVGRIGFVERELGRGA